MKAEQFKTEIKKIKANLLGITNQIVFGENSHPYKTLNEFGNAVLTLEKNYNDFNVVAVWVEKQRVKVNSFNELADLFTTKKITCVCFTAEIVVNSLSESMANDKFLD